MDGALAIAGSPIFAGGNAAMLIILDAVQEKGIETVGTFCLVLLVTQKFFGIPIASLMLRHLAKNKISGTTGFRKTLCVGGGRK